jgi:hypothetical protein
MVREEAMEQTGAVEEFRQAVLYDLRRSVRDRSSTEPSLSTQLRRTRWIGT